MSDAELLATLICRGKSRVVANKITSELLSRFGGLRALLHADAVELCSYPGIGPAKAAVIRALPELARRYFETSLSPGESSTLR